MADHDDDELQMALRMSLQGSPPEAKRSKPRECPEEPTEQSSRRLQRELMAAAAEKRIRAAVESRKSSLAREEGRKEPAAASSGGAVVKVVGEKKAEGEAGKVLEAGEALSQSVVEQLFDMVFGSGVSKDVLAQWSNQGIRFSSDPETSMGLVQHEGGPCGVLATIQAYVLKYLLFFPDDLGNLEVSTPLHTLGQRRFYQTCPEPDDFVSISDERKTRALLHSMVEILFLCGSGKKAVVASIGFSAPSLVDEHEADHNKMIDKVLVGLSVESALDLQKVLRVGTFISQKAAFDYLTANIAHFQCRMGAMLFLISVLLSRGLDSIQEDRDDPSQPLVTAPFGHASQEIVNLLLCGEAVPNVFDGRMDLGGGMFLKGIPADVEVGFLTLLESLNLCKVGQYLKHPKWPIWVVGSESHYTVLFALDRTVQEENELEGRESKIRRVFDAQDQSGGGGFISVEGFHQVLRETDINFPPDKLETLTNAGFIVWSEFWQALLELDKGLGGMRDPTSLMGKKQFDIYHFNGIAKSVVNGGGAGTSPSVQRPRLCKLSSVVPPRWTREEYLADVAISSASDVAAQPPQISWHAPLVDCIRTRWPRAECSWVGDAPSIV